MFCLWRPNNVVLTSKRRVLTDKYRWRDPCSLCQHLYAFFCDVFFGLIWFAIVGLIRELENFVTNLGDVYKRLKSKFFKYSIEGEEVFLCCRKPLFVRSCSFVRLLFLTRWYIVCCRLLCKKYKDSFIFNIYYRVNSIQNRFFLNFILPWCNRHKIDFTTLHGIKCNK